MVKRRARTAPAAVAIAAAAGVTIGGACAGGAGPGRRGASEPAARRADDRRADDRRADDGRADDPRDDDRRAIVAPADHASPAPAAPAAAPPAADPAPAPIDPSAPVVLASFARQTPHALAVAGAWVYWTDRAGGDLWRVPIAGGDAARVATGLAEPRELAVAGDAVLVATDDGVVRVDPATGAARALVPGGEGDLVAVAGDALIVAEPGGRVVRVDLAPARAAGGATPRVTTLADHLPPPAALAIDPRRGAAIVVVDVAPALWRVPLAGGAPRLLARLPAASVVLALDDERAYVQPLGGGDLLAVPLAGGAAAPVLDAVGPVDALAVDAAGVWWTSMADGRVSGAGRAALAQHALFRDHPRATGLVAAGGALYWFDWTLGGGPGAIVRAAEPALASP